MSLNVGYTLMCEQRAPRPLVADAIAAEDAGFDFAVMSDHYFPWLDEMGHSPNAWPVLGAVAQATTRLELMTYVTCPIRRYHPAVIAQAAATTNLLAEGRFTLGVGAGENLNEHVIGGGWPAANTRHEMLDEALQIITALWEGGYVNFRGRHFEVDSAKIWDLGDKPRLGVAVSGAQSCALAGKYADAMIAVEPEPELGQHFDQAGGKGKPRIGQLPVSFDRDRDRAIERAHRLFRWFGGGWKVNAELPGPTAFDAAYQFVTPKDVAEGIPCGDDPDAVADALGAFVDAGFTHVALCQIGGDQQAEFIQWSEKELLPSLRSRF
jgi:G6PDH family F420-dependent oxidoreductase